MRSGGRRGSADSNSSGHRSWWSNTNRLRPMIPKARPRGQKMSGGLQACRAWNLLPPPHLLHQPRRCEKRVDVLEEVSDRPGPAGIRAVLVDLDPVDDLVVGVPRALGADDRHVVAGGDERLAFEPDPSVERDRQVLDDYEDVLVGGTSYHPTPS